MKRNPLKISLIEDDDDDIFLFSMALENSSIPNQLTVVKDGIEIEKNIKLLETTAPDIIFLDLLWRYIDGVEYLNKIRNSQLLKDTPCVIFSGAKEDLYIEKAFSAGANLYLVKPRDFAVLTQTLDKALSLDWKEYFPPKYESFILSEI
ncbi:response regulator [Emticicia sp. C21]|uniref:response regulator n=1 Tax=Emticicia sp. C21 TaxID=2302915 RepID=UPI000E350270|nr:response regulator [Emticicia sp. C21]RFS17034.1 response regulator [Emticicia sp. C21]